MLRNEFKMAWRHIRLGGFYSALNLAGLSVAMAAFLMLINYVRFEKSYETFHKNADNIWRVTLDLYNGSEYLMTDCETYPGLGPLLKEKTPEVVEYVRMQSLGELELSHEKKTVFAVKPYGADPSLFSVFSYELLYGDKETVLSGPMQAVVSETLAKKLFGATDVLGKNLKVAGESAVITGVTKDVPENSHLKFDFLISFESLRKWGLNPDSWSGNNNYLYLQMKPGAGLEAFNRTLKTLSQERLKNEILVAEKIKTIHLHSNKTFEPEVNGDARVVRFLLSIAVFIIFIGAANYINLTTARASERGKESGMRIIMGASRLALVRSFFWESVIFNVLGLAGALLLICVSSRFYSSLVGPAAGGTLFGSGGFWLLVLALLVISTLLSGVYPAFVSASARVSKVGARNFTGPPQGKTVRKILVVTQFAIVFCVLVAAAVVYLQLSFLRTQDLGMNLDEKLAVKMAQVSGQDSAQYRRMAGFRDDLLAIPGVQKAALTDALPGGPLHQLNTQTAVRRIEETAARGYNYYLYGIDAEYLSLLQIPLAAGRNFVAGFPNRDELIVNEESVRLLGFASPEAAIGRELMVNSGEIRTGTIVGVIKNYRQQSLKGDQLPMIHWFSDRYGSYFLLKVNAPDMHGVVSSVQKLWQSRFPGHVFDYFFLDEMYNRQYKNDEQFGRIINVFLGVTLFITMLGITGLAAYTALRKRKEIGVRKVLGASVQSIVLMFSGEFAGLAGIAFLVGIPLSWFAMNKWLDGFANRIQIGWWIFAVAGIAVAAMALLTVSLQSIRAATANPVDALRNE